MFCSLTGSGVFSVCGSGISLVDVHGAEKTPTHRTRKFFNENSYNVRLLQIACIHSLKPQRKLSDFYFNHGTP